MTGDGRNGAIPGESASAGGSLGFDISVAHPARVYNYLLGGKDNFAADREAAQQMIAGGAKVLVGVPANRAFLGRAVRFLAEAAGTLDLGQPVAVMILMTTSGWGQCARPSAARRRSAGSSTASSWSRRGWCSSPVAA